MIEIIKTIHEAFHIASDYAQAQGLNESRAQGYATPLEFDRQITAQRMPPTRALHGPD